MTLRQAMRAVVDRAAARAGVLSRRERATRDALTVVTYHRVLPEELCAGSPLPGLVMPARAFENQVEFFARRYDVVTLSEGVRRLGELGHPPQAEEPPRRPLLVITFDDGYRDNAEIAGPILARAGVPATFFLVSGFVGSDSELWFDEAARWHASAQPTQVAQAITRLAGMSPPTHTTSAADATTTTHAAGPQAPTSLRAWMQALKSADPSRRSALLDEARSGALAPARPLARRRPMDFAMSWDQAAVLARGGHEIGAHTHTHPILPQLSDIELEDEIAGCARFIESRLARRPRGLCYPNGDCDERVVRVARAAGFEHAPTTKPGLNRAGADPFRLARINMNPQTLLPGGGHDEAILRAELTLMHHKPGA